jgi:hypothetical protein
MNAPNSSRRLAQNLKNTLPQERQPPFPVRLSSVEKDDGPSRLVVARVEPIPLLERLAGRRRGSRWIVRDELVKVVSFVISGRGGRGERELVGVDLDRRGPFGFEFCTTEMAPKRERERRRALLQLRASEERFGRERDVGEGE